MNYQAWFQRDNDGSGYAAVYLARDGEALAVGNGYDAYDDTNPNFLQHGLIRNTFAHAHTSAEFAYKEGSGVARLVGLWKEDTPFVYESADEFADQWNNEVGRRMAAYAKANNLPESSLDSLVVDAFNRPVAKVA